jgi:hypothetical protein
MIPPDIAVFALLLIFKVIFANIASYIDKNAKRFY